MSEIQNKMIERAKQLLESGEVARVVGWKKGEFLHDPSPASFETVESLKDFVYNDFCGANLSKYMIQICKKEGKTAIFLKPCDSYSFNQLIKEYRVKKENVLVIAISCNGKLDNNKLMRAGVDGVIGEEYDKDTVKLQTLDGEKVLNKSDVLLDKCLSCKTKVHALKDEEIIIDQVDTTIIDRFSLVKELEEMTADERFKFWQNQLSKCIRCNACRNVCPACSCVKCVFDNNNSGISAKANDTEFEEKLYHIIRAFHVSGRCTDCGECSRVCPQNIPLHLLNRKFIKDINVLYGEYQAGAESEGRTPLTSFTTEDVEPNDALTEARK